MKALLFTVTFLFNNLLALQTLWAEETSKQQASQIKTILVFGDSLSAAYNIKREEGWVSLLQDFVTTQNKQVKIVNASISGETTSGGLERLTAQLESTQPQIIIIELGGNDGLRGFDLATTRSNLAQMINISLNRNIKVILTEIQLPPNFGRTYTKRFSQIYTDLSQQNSVTLIPQFLDKVGTDKSLMLPDGIHPNAKGQPILMQTVWKYLSPLIE